MDTPTPSKTSSEYEAELKAANEEVYKHSLELATLSKELAEANRRQETLIHFISHEVKGYMTKDQAVFAALLEGDVGVLPESARSLVEGAVLQVRSGVVSVTDILKASNQKKGTVSYKREPFDLKALTLNAVKKARGTAEEKKLNLTLHLDESETYQAVGDKEQFAEHVVRNLVDNAVSYTPSGAIDVTLKKEGDKCILFVKDTGVGITAEDMERLFTEGGHGKESQKVNAHSTGYGLFIAKNVTEAMGGTIRAESEGALKGSTFIVELPAAD